MIVALRERDVVKNPRSTRQKGGPGTASFVQFNGENIFSEISIFKSNICVEYRNEKIHCSTLQINKLILI